ncbi:glycosyltransferase family 2 protein [Flavobacterium algicola]|uniref:glycosyltransferase family 2 protein n=1 Tax=Flavobacterium algicola TaxID=556529 RepID=UPI001EFCFB82|nr:glycosyltransferase family 2 protein [Flavobacterium algicola]MCG9793895.1 glycosyltransferase [Flavobacterium algicola]
MSSRISVIIPCYNQAQFLDETLRSVLNQTYVNWECIIIDDGSTDSSKDVAMKWCTLDERFRYVFQTNGGLSNARNNGLQLAKGKYIQFLDADDLLKHNKFESQLRDLENAQVSVSDYFSFVDGNILELAKHRYLSPFVSEVNFKKDIILDWEYRISIPCHAVLFQKSLVVENCLLFNEALPNHEDWVFWTQLFYVSKNITNNKNVLALYRIRERSMSTNYVLMRDGFIKASEVLLSYFKERNEKELVKAVRIKQKEIVNKNTEPLLKKIKKAIKSKLTFIYKYVKSN